MLANENLVGFERLFQALCDRTRIRLLSLMAGGPVSVGFLANQLGESQPKTSRHLAYLRGAGLVSASREGKWVYYGIDPEADPSVKELLLQTLDALDGKSIRREDSTTVRTTPAGGEISAHSAISIDWNPNEMDIHLL